MWESIFHSLMPGRSTWFLTVGGLGPVLWLFVRELRDRQRREEVESPPQEEKLLRPPGHSLSLKLDIIWEVFLVKLSQCVGCGMLSSMFWPMPPN